MIGFKSSVQYKINSNEWKVCIFSYKNREAIGNGKYEFEIIATDAVGESRQFCKINSLYYNGTVSFNEYASLVINTVIGNFEVDYDAGDIVTPPSMVLKVTPSTSNPVTYKMLITLYAP